MPNPLRRELLLWAGIIIVVVFVAAYLGIYLPFVRR